MHLKRNTCGPTLNALCIYYHACMYLCMEKPAWPPNGCDMLALHLASNSRSPLHHGHVDGHQGQEEETAGGTTPHRPDQQPPFSTKDGACTHILDLLPLAPRCMPFCSSQHRCSHKINKFISTRNLLLVVNGEGEAVEACAISWLMTMQAPAACIAQFAAI